MMLAWLLELFYEGLFSLLLDYSLWSKGELVLNYFDPLALITSKIWGPLACLFVT